MPTNAKVLRADRFAEIGAVIQRDAGTIIERWSKRAVEEQPKARRVHHEVLLDHLASFLAELGRGLAESGDPYNCPHCRSADEHGDQRWEAGWSLAELVRDYQLLRLVVLEYLDETLERPLRLREVMAVGLALDESIEASVVRYVRERDGQFRRLEESLHKQAEALREADCRKNEFLATLAHELRDPLAPLRNSLEVLRLAGNPPPAFPQLRDRMERQVHQITRLVEDLLDVSRVAQGKLVLRKECLDLRAVIAQAVQMNAPLVEARKHQMSVAQPSDVLPVEGDQARLIQVVVNLLNNAAKYTPHGGRIAIALEADADEAVIRVRDNGVGIPQERLGHIFDLFTQIDISPERPQAGLGIGLTLVRRLVELHGGRITASSPGVGQGSEFCVRLPRAEANPKEVDAAGDGAQAVPSRRVLIVEDNADGRESLALLLQLVGHEVHTAEDGPKGVKAAVALRPEVALIDIGLPGLDGYQVAREVRSALGRGIALVALTGHSQPEDRQRAREAGFDAHLTKPVELEELQDLLAKAASPTT